MPPGRADSIAGRSIRTTTSPSANCTSSRSRPRMSRVRASCSPACCASSVTAASAPGTPCGIAPGAGSASAAACSARSRRCSTTIFPRPRTAGAVVLCESEVRTISPITDLVAGPSARTAALAAVPLRYEAEVRGPGLAPVTRGECAARVRARFVFLGAWHGRFGGAPPAVPAGAAAALVRGGAARVVQRQHEAGGAAPERLAGRGHVHRPLASRDRELRLPRFARPRGDRREGAADPGRGRSAAALPGRAAGAAPLRPAARGDDAAVPPPRARARRVRADRGGRPHRGRRRRRPRGLARGERRPRALCPRLRTGCSCRCSSARASRRSRPSGSTGEGGVLPDPHFSTAHQLGSCRMADDPSRGVVDSEGEAHGYPGLFVCDGAAIPGALAVNPSLTIVAHAERVAERVIRRFPSGRAPARSRAGDPGAAASRI